MMNPQDPHSSMLANQVIDPQVPVAGPPCLRDPRDPVSPRPGLPVFLSRMPDRLPPFEITRLSLLEAVRGGEQSQCGRIEAFFQPQLDLATGRLRGAEALARWRLPDGDVLPPSAFLAEAHAFGVIDQIDEAVQESGLAVLGALDGALPAVSFNASAEGLRDPDYLDRLRFRVDRLDLAPEAVTIEVVESTLIESDDDIAIRNIRALGASGFRVELDDFGSGHAALTNLVRLDLDAIKIDRALTSKAAAGGRSITILRAIVALANEIGLSTIAEGVETEADLAAIAALGCTAVQGYAIARPMAAEDLEAWIATRERTHVPDTVEALRA